MSTSDFNQLGLIEAIRRALAQEGYVSPTPIQAAAIPHLLSGRDLLGCAQTGTGKTAAFALPILQRLNANHRPLAPRSPRVLVLTPTRELAAQIHENFGIYGRHLRLRQTVIFGGVGQAPQVSALRGGVDILVATPGRLLDLMGQGHLRLDRVEIFVLDEADRMLDMGFVHDVRRVIAVLPARRQSLFFSATMPPDVTDLARTMLTDPVRVEVAPSATTVERVEQKVMFVAKPDKRDLLVDVLKNEDVSRVLVFTRTKHGADRLVRQLGQSRVQAEAIHGDRSQNNRTRALENFRNGSTRVLVATDIAARGIDVDGITHVINFDIPEVPETYVHRIGRTARAGSDGVAISFCDSEERGYFRDIERVIRHKVPVVADHPWHAFAPADDGTASVASPPGRGDSFGLVARTLNGRGSHRPSQGADRRLSARGLERGSPASRASTDRTVERVGWRTRATRRGRNQARPSAGRTRGSFGER